MGMMNYSARFKTILTVVYIVLALCFIGLPFSFLAFGSDIQTQQNPLYPYRSSVFISDEFYGGTTTTGNIGSIGWSLSACTATPSGGTANNPGFYRLDTTAVINTLCRVFSQAGAINPINKNHSEITVARLNTNDANTIVRIGDSDGFSASPPTNGIYFEKLAADTNWFVVTRSAGVETRTDTGVAINTNFNSFAFTVTSASVIFQLNNATVATHTTNIPSVTGGLNGWFITNTAAASKTLDLDYWQGIFTGLSR